MQPKKQFQPTPELQGLLDSLSPSLNKLLKRNNGKLNLRCFSKYDDDKHKFDLFFEDEEKKVYSTTIV